MERHKYELRRSGLTVADPMPSSRRLLRIPSRVMTTRSARKPSGSTRNDEAKRAKSDVFSFVIVDKVWYQAVREKKLSWWEQ